MPGINQQPDDLFHQATRQPHTTQTPADRRPTPCAKNGPRGAPPDGTIRPPRDSRRRHGRESRAHPQPYSVAVAVARIFSTFLTRLMAHDHGLAVSLSRCPAGSQPVKGRGCALIPGPSLTWRSATPPAAAFAQPASQPGRAAAQLMPAGPAMASAAWTIPLLYTGVARFHLRVVEGWATGGGHGAAVTARCPGSGCVGSSPPIPAGGRRGDAEAAGRCRGRGTGGVRPPGGGFARCDRGRTGMAGGGHPPAVPRPARPGGEPADNRHCRTTRGAWGHSRPGGPDDVSRRGAPGAVGCGRPALAGGAERTSFVLLDILPTAKAGGFQRSPAGVPVSPTTARPEYSVEVLHRLHRLGPPARRHVCCALR